MSQRFTTDVLIIGGGAAGLTAALTLSQHAGYCAVQGYHQRFIPLGLGGVAAVTDPEDSFESHVEDTLDAGAACVTPKWFERRSVQRRQPSPSSPSGE